MLIGLEQRRHCVRPGTVSQAGSGRPGNSLASWARKAERVAGERRCTLASAQFAERQALSTAPARLQDATARRQNAPEATAQRTAANPTGREVSLVAACREPALELRYGWGYRLPATSTCASAMTSDSTTFVPALRTAVATSVVQVRLIPARGPGRDPRRRARRAAGAAVLTLPNHAGHGHQGEISALLTHGEGTVAASKGASMGRPRPRGKRGRKRWQTQHGRHPGG